MNEITRYFPAFVERREPPEKAEFGNWEDLLRIPWVRKWSTMTDFSRYSISRDRQLTPMLMAELKEGREWWVIGFLDGDVTELPNWEPKQ